MLYGSRQFHCLHKNTLHLWRHCRSCWNKFGTSNYELDRPLWKIKNKKVIGLMKDELGEIIMMEFVGLRAKTYGYL